jgi:hypothetical protein
MNILGFETLEMELGTTKMWALSGKNRCGPGKPEGIYVCIYIYIHD